MKGGYIRPPARPAGRADACKFQGSNLAALTQRPDLLDRPRPYAAPADPRHGSRTGPASLTARRRTALPGGRRAAARPAAPSRHCFRQARVAVFVDGCFWHGCPDHGRRPTTSNPRYWSEKVERNQTRDRDTDECLAAAGWAAMRVWEHEAPGEAAARIAATSVLAGSDWPTEHSRTLLATPRRRRKPVLELMS